MVSEDTRAILGSDLAKIFATIIAFIAVYVLIPVVYPAIINVLTTIGPLELTSMSFSTFFGIFLMVLLLLFWTVFLFFGIFKLVSALQKKRF